MSRIRMGVCSRVVMTTSSRSESFRMKPRPRMMYSTRLISIVRAPVSRFAFLTALATWPIVTLCASMASGSTSTWYSRT